MRSPRLGRRRRQRVGGRSAQHPAARRRGPLAAHRHLASDPAHAAELRRLRAALDAWLARTSDLGAIPEAELRERSWPGGVEPLTPAPSITLRYAQVVLEVAVSGASIGYRRIGGGVDARWRLYDGPFPARSGERIEARAVRYGWAESPVASARIP